MFTLLVFCRRCFRAAVLGLVFIRFSHTVLPLNTFRTRSRFHSNWNVPLPSHCIVANVERMRTRKKRRRNVCPIDGLTAEHDERRVERQTNRMNDRLTDEPNERQTDRQTTRLSPRQWDISAECGEQTERKRERRMTVSEQVRRMKSMRARVCVCVYCAIASSFAHTASIRRSVCVCVCQHLTVWLCWCIFRLFTVLRCFLLLPLPRLLLLLLLLLLL